MTWKYRSSRFPIGSSIPSALCFIFLFLCILFAYLVISIITSLPNGIPIVPLIVFSIGILIVLLIIWSNSKSYSQQPLVGFKERNPSICKRVVKDGFEGKEIIISGKHETTFRDACLKNWDFRRTDKDSKWFIVDDSGNDITNLSLISYEGIGIMIAEYGQSKKFNDFNNDAGESTSIHDSVEYYD